MEIFGWFLHFLNQGLIRGFDRFHSRFTIDHLAHSAILKNGHCSEERRTVEYCLKKSLVPTSFLGRCHWAAFTNFRKLII